MQNKAQAPLNFIVSSDGEVGVIIDGQKVLGVHLEIDELREMAFALLGAACVLEDSTSEAMRQFDEIVCGASTTKQKGTA